MDTPLSDRCLALGRELLEQAKAHETLPDKHRASARRVKDLKTAARILVEESGRLTLEGR